MKDLARQSFHALKWNYLGNGVRALSQLVIGIVLARLLGPEAFGTIAIAWLMIGIGMLISDLGFGAALVQRADLREKDIQFVFTVQMCLGAALAVIGVSLAGLVGAFFRRPDAAPVIRAMALLFFLQAFGQTSLALLRRSLDFKAAQGIGVASYLVGYVAVGIPCAYLGWGAWSLAAAQLFQAGVSSVLALWLAPVRVRPTLTPATPGLLAFGAKVVGSNATSWSISNLDSFVVGRVLGVVDLGLYSRAMTLVASPMTAMTTSFQAVLFAASSRAQADSTKVRRAFLGATTVLVGISLPVFVTAAIVPSTVIVGVYGGKWAVAAPAFVPLALGMPVGALLALAGPVLTALNRVEVELRNQAVALAAMLPVLYLAARHSLAAVAWAMLGVSVLRCALLITAVLRLIDAAWADILRALSWPAVCAAATAVATWCIDRAIPVGPPALRLVCDVVTAAVTLLLSVVLVRGRLLEGPHAQLILAEGGLPGSVRKWLSARGTP